jgi:hypothetical protein
MLAKITCAPKDLVYGKLYDGLIKLGVRARKSSDEILGYQTLAEIQKAILDLVSEESKGDAETTDGNRTAAKEDDVEDTGLPSAHSAEHECCTR